MFSLLRWLIIIFVVVAIWYLVNFFMTLNTQERGRVKKDVIEAIDSGDPTVFTAPIKERVREDLTQKKNDFFERMRDKLKNAVDWLIDDTVAPEK